MNRYSVVTVVAIIVIVSPFAVSAINVVGVQQTDYRWNSAETFSFFKLSTGGELEFCNRLPFFVNFQNFDVTMYYKEKELGTYSTGPLALDPYSSSVRDGVFRSSDRTAAHNIFMTFDFGVAGGEAMRINPADFIVETKADTPIIGLIPYSTTTSMGGLEFDQIMRADDPYCN